MLSYKTIPILLYLVVECFSHKIVTFYPTRLFPIARTSVLFLPRTQVLLEIGTTIRSADSTNLFQHACTSILQQPSTTLNPASLPIFPRFLQHKVPESRYRNMLYNITNMYEESFTTKLYQYHTHKLIGLRPTVIHVLAEIVINFRLIF